MSSADARPEAARPVTLRGALLATLVGLVILFLIAEITVRILMPHWRDFYSGHFMHAVKVNGYGGVLTGRPGFDGHFAQNNGDFRVRVSINGFGLRNPEEVAAADDRVWVVGNSMTFGWGVEQSEMYSTVAARLAGIGTYNLASPGTNICGYEALVARMPASVQPRALVVGLVLENDVRQYKCPRGNALPGREHSESTGGSLQLLTVKRFLMHHLALYNFVAVAMKRVDILSALLVELGLVQKAHENVPHADLSKMPALVESTAAELDFLRSLRTADQPFVVLAIPARLEIRDGHPWFAALRRAMLDALASRGIAAIDLLTDLREAGFESTHFAHDGHWNPRGHEVAARAVANWMASALPNPGPRRMP